MIKNERGFAIIEVVIALAIIGLIAAAFLIGLATASKALIVADERTTAESLARSQMEYVKNQDYIDYSEDPHNVYNEITPPVGYSIDSTAEPIDPATGLPYGQTGGVFFLDDDIQQITVIVSHGDEVLTLDSYKVNR